MSQDNGGFVLSTQNNCYDVRVSIVFGSNVEVAMDMDSIRIPFSSYAMEVKRSRPTPRESANSLTPMSIKLKSFSSIDEAERAGRQLVLALLWTSPANRISISFKKKDGDLPFEIVDNRIIQIRGTADANMYTRIPLESIINTSIIAFQSVADIQNRLLTSIEFYAAARMETTEIARFISLMTALESLSEQKIYNDSINELLNELAATLESSSIFIGEDGVSTRCSLASSIRGLRRESVRRAIRNKLKVHLPDDTHSLRFIDDAYSQRSKILHEGARVSNLYEYTNKLESILRQLYSNILGLPLNR